MKQQGDKVNPRRRSMAGPALLSSYTAPGAMRKSFAVTNTYFRNFENTGLEPVVKSSAAPTEDLKLNGNMLLLLAVETTKDVLTLKYTEKYESIAAGFTDGMIRLFKSTTGENIQTLFDTETQQNSEPVTCIKHRPVTKTYPITNSLTCTYASGCVKCWNYNFCQCIYTIREKRQTYGLAYHPRLPKFVTYGDDSRIFVYDEETRTQERILSSSESPDVADGHSSRIFSACFNPRSNYEVITGGWDNLILFWDLRQPHALRHISGVHIGGDGLDINSRGTEILSCAWQPNDSMQIWDYNTGKLLSSIEPDVYSSKLYCGNFAGKNYAVAGGIDPNLLRIVDLRSQVSVGNVTGIMGGVYSFDIGSKEHQPPVQKPTVTKSRKDFHKQILKKTPIPLPNVVFCSGKKIYQIGFP